MSAEADLAALGLKLETKDLEKGIQVLDKAGASAEKAADKFDRASKDTVESNKKQGKSFDDVAVAVQGSAAAYLSLAAGVGAAVAIGKQAIANAEEAIQVQKRLEAVYRATGGTVGYTTAELNKMADAMAASTSFDDESIRNGMAELIKFGNIHGKVFTEALQLAADYAAFSKTDFPSAAAEMARALKAPEEAQRLLKGTTSKLTDTQRDYIQTLIDSGREEEAQMIILDKFKGAYSGLDAALNTGLTRSVNDLKKAWDELLESIGRTQEVTGATNALANYLRGVKAVIDDGDWLDRLFSMNNLLMMIPGGSIVVPTIKGLTTKPPKAPGTSSDPAALAREAAAQAQRELDADMAMGDANMANFDKQVAKEKELARRKSLAKAEEDKRYWAEFDKQNAENLVTELEGNVKLREKYQAEELKRQQDLAKDRYAALVAEGEFDRKNQIKAYEDEKALNAKLLKQAEDDADAKMKLIEKESEARQKMVDDINKSLTDALLRGFESGKGFAKNFKDTLVNMFKTLILRPVISFIVNPVSQAITTALGGLFSSGTASAATSAAGSSGGIGSLISGGQSIWSAFSGGTTSLATSFATSSIGSALGLSTTSMITAADAMTGLAVEVGSTATSLTSAGAAFASAAPWIAGGLAVASLLGGSLFGGGHVSRPKEYANTQVNAASNQVLKTWTNSDGGAQGQAASVGDSLGNSIRSIAALLGGEISKSIEIGTKYSQKYNVTNATIGRGISKTDLDFYMNMGKSAEVAGGHALAFLLSVQRGFVKVDGWIKKIIDGSDAGTATAQKVVNDIAGLKNIHDQVASLPDVFKGVSNAIERIGFGQLVNSGALDKIKALESATENFYNLFYSDTEKFNTNSILLHKSLSTLGVAFPETREEFKNLVKSLDTTTISGSNLFSALVNISGPMDAYYTALGQQKNAANEAAKAISESTDRYATLTDFMRAKAYIANGIPLSELPSYDVGTPYVPTTGPALIHRGERILTAQDNSGLSSAIASIATEIGFLKRDLSEISKYSRKTSETLTRVTLDGEAMQTKVAA